MFRQCVLPHEDFGGRLKEELEERRRSDHFKVNRRKQEIQKETQTDTAVLELPYKI